MSDKRIHSGKWTKFAQQVLKEDGYVCAVEGCDTRASHVDHILPRSKFPELMYDRSNLQSLCQFHNTSKGAKMPGDQRNTWFNPDWFPSEYIKERMKQ
ncbi:hypothetical protein CH262_12515 [Rhodococcus sp. 05-2255-1e]|uniref:HNH endonuclease n=1 Tax=Rhodococcus sp. 05-2255-1e TaxID=2022495 RepID=UPI000B9A3B51|nr:hypothetical protein CH262_12515 [Rhodococcus sp. 05-2255-1e]